MEVIDSSPTHRVLVIQTGRAIIVKAEDVTGRGVDLCEKSGRGRVIAVIHGRTTGFARRGRRRGRRRNERYGNESQ